MKHASRLGLYILVALILNPIQSVSAIDFNQNTEHLLPFFREGSTLTSACGLGRSSSGGTTAPPNIPEPLRSIFSAAAEEHQADATMIAVIYATENALYQQDRHLDSDWLIDRVHANDWPQSNLDKPVSQRAKGPFQFLDGTFGDFSQEGPFTRADNRWTLETGPGDGINVNHIDDAAFAAAEFLASIGGVSGVPLGSIDQDFSRNNDVGDTIANALKSYNGGPGTWRENGVWRTSTKIWDEGKQTEINNYITNGLEMYTELSGGGSISSGGGCSSLSYGGGDIINIANEADAWPEFKDRRLIEPTAIVLHWTGGNPNATGRDFIGHIAGRPGLCCGVQFFVNASGEIYQLTDPIHEITSHITPWNDVALGIEIAAGSDGTIPTAEREIFAQTAQTEAVTQLVLFLMEEYNIPVLGNIPDQCNGGRPNGDPVGIIGHIDDPCSTKVDPSQAYVDLIRSRVGGGA